MKDVKEIAKQIIVTILTWEARLVLKKYKPQIIAVTGTVGKTSTKDAIFEVLSTQTFARKSEKSYNSEFGVPLAILGRSTGWRNPFAWMSILFEGVLLIIFKNHYPKSLVLEVGTDHPGDIARITRWLKPDVVVVTRMSNVPVHVEFFDSPEAVLAEKANLVKALKPEGTLVLNSDDNIVLSMKKHTKAHVHTFGFGEESMLWASNEEIIYEHNRPVGIAFKVEHGGNTYPVTLYNTIGHQYIYHALAALSVGVVTGLNFVNMIEGISRFAIPAGRLRVLDGLKETVIIDDTYNSSPIACESALEALGSVRTQGRKIVCFGDMLELGKYSAQEHKRIGKLCAQAADMLLTVGPRARVFAEGALIGGMSEKHIYQYDDVERCANELERMIHEGDAILIKGSQSMRMERVVEEIMANPERKNELLVRQEDVWQ